MQLAFELYILVDDLLGLLAANGSSEMRELSERAHKLRLELEAALATVPPPGAELARRLGERSAGEGDGS